MDKSALKSEQVVIVHDIVDDANLEQQQALLEWGKDLLAIRHSDDLVVAKVKAAITVTAQRKVIWPIVRVVLYRLKRLGWDERSWKARLGIGYVQEQARYQALSRHGAPARAIPPTG